MAGGDVVSPAWWKWERCCRQARSSLGFGARKERAVCRGQGEKGGGPTWRWRSLSSRENPDPMHGGEMAHWRLLPMPWQALPAALCAPQVGAQPCLGAPAVPLHATVRASFLCKELFTF